MLSRILLRMTPLAFVLVLSLTSLVDIQVTAEPEQGGSSETIISLLSMGGDESETDWLDQFSISSRCKKALFIGIIFGAPIGFLVRGWWGILVGAAIGVVVSAIIRCLIIDTLCPDWFFISDRYRDGLLQGTMLGAMAGVLSFGRNMRGILMGSAIAVVVGIVLEYFVFGILWPNQFPISDYCKYMLLLSVATIGSVSLAGCIDKHGGRGGILIGALVGAVMGMVIGIVGCFVRDMLFGA
ncbi:hypothetical protein [Pasteuria penetrans]|uniref:hypothetical protein n=1 Tax=Pasteuria penetrans TaxID=86005 RepID=UPI0011ED9622|nr:hypothetical protein [Pasteuria penetrans]